MKKRLISLCLALAFVLAALPGNLVSLAADSIGDLVGGEAVGVWGDFSKWVIMDETASFKADSATLYYNPATQPKNTVTLTGEDVPASFQVEYMLPLTEADGTVSYWYVLNTEEWDAFADADACPPYVRVEDVTDLTYLEVQGATDGVSAEFEKVDAATAPEEVDTSHMSGVTSIRGYDISLKDENGAAWQPKDHGTTVTVRVYGAWDITVENPIVDIYHVHGDGTVEVLSNTTGDVTLWPDGSVSFETDSFSNYYVVAGFQDGNGNEGAINLGNGDVIYAAPGATVRFSNRNRTWTLQTGESDPVTVATDGYSITISENAKTGEDYVYNVGGKTVTLAVRTRQEIAQHYIQNGSVYLAVLGNATNIPTEPKVTWTDFTRISGSYTAGDGYFGSTFKSSATGYIKEEIAEALVPSINGDNVAGVVDPTGAKCLQYLTDAFDWDRVLDAIADASSTAGNWIGDNSVRAIDGQLITDNNKSEYKVVPYVIKLMDNGDWHIDCAVVPITRATLAYDLNLANYIVTDKTIYAPDAVTKEPTFDVGVGSIEYGGAPLGVGENGKIKATLSGKEYEVTFLGWSTDPTATTADEVDYKPGDTIKVAEDTVLYAVWSGKAKSFALKYEIIGAIAGGTVNPQGETLNTSTSAATGSTVTVKPGYQFVGWYDKDDNLLSTDVNYIPATPTEGWPEGVTTYYAKIVENEVTINYVVDGPAGCGTVAPTTQTVGVVTGTPSSTAAVSSNTYKFVGWYDKDGNKLSDELTYNPAKVNDLHVAATYYAKFEYNLTSLTISKTGWESIDPNQTFIFNVNGNGVNLDVTVHGNGSVTIDGLTVGATYTITEKTDWSWRYQCSGWTHTNGGNGSSNVASITLGLNGTITFTNTRPNEQWLDGDSWCDNRFN